MAEERTLGLARAPESLEEPSKAELQRRMDEARDSITNTVSEIKDTVAQQVETVKDALDWREQFKKRPVAWSLGAAGVGFCAGYCVAATIKGDSDEPRTASTTYERLYGDIAPVPTQATPGPNGHSEGPGLIERFRETSAYDRLSREAGAIGDRVVEELSTVATAVVLPKLLDKVKSWIGVDLGDKKPSMGQVHDTSSRESLHGGVTY